MKQAQSPTHSDTEEEARQKRIKELEARIEKKLVKLHYTDSPYSRQNLPKWDKKKFLRDAIAARKTFSDDDLFGQQSDR